MTKQMSHDQVLPSVCLWLWVKPWAVSPLRFSINEEGLRRRFDAASVSLCSRWFCSAILLLTCFCTASKRSARCLQMYAYIYIWDKNALYIFLFIAQWKTLTCSLWAVLRYSLCNSANFLRSWEKTTLISEVMAAFYVAQVWGQMQVTFSLSSECSVDLSCSSQCRISPTVVSMLLSGHSNTRLRLKCSHDTASMALAQLVDVTFAI